RSAPAARQRSALSAPVQLKEERAMRLPLQWLADFVDVDRPVDELALALTMAGIKVEAVERIGVEWTDVVVGEVIHIEPHATARKPLHVAQVSLGGEEPIIVVTGAQNVRQGDRIPVVPVGGHIPYGPDGKPLKIERRPMAGITSNGM